MAALADYVDYAATGAKGASAASVAGETLMRADPKPPAGGSGLAWLRKGLSIR